MSLSERLGECLRLLAAATPGPWSVLRAPFGKSLGNNWRVAECGGASDDSGNHVYVVAEIQDYCEAAENDAALIVALHQLLREDGPALVAAVRDAERWRYLRDTPMFDEAVYADLGNERCAPIDREATVDAAIDAAINKDQQP